MLWRKVKDIQNNDDIFDHEYNQEYIIEREGEYPTTLWSNVAAV